MTCHLKYETVNVAGSEHLAVFVDMEPKTLVCLLASRDAGDRLAPAKHLGRVLRYLAENPVDVSLEAVRIRRAIEATSLGDTSVVAEDAFV